MPLASRRSRNLVALTSGAALAIVGVTAVASPATAAGHIECGDTILEDTVLISDLVCDGTTDALIVGADNVVLDLGGHTITGPGAYQGTGSGIRLTGRSGVTVQKGTITGFQSGVVIDSGADNTVTKVSAVANDRGVTLANAAGSLVSQSTFADNGRDGVAIGGAGSAGSVVTQNTITGNVWGITINATPDATLSRNTIDANRFGIAVFAGASAAVVSQNTVTNSVFDGIETSGDTTGSTVSQNTSSFNGGYGFKLFGTGTAVKNKAEANGEGAFWFGPSFTNGGGNKAL